MLNELIYLKNGVLKVYKIDGYDNEIFMYNIHKGEFITEAVGSEQIQCFANAEFVEDSEIISINYKNFQEILKDDNDLLFKILNDFSSKIQKMQCIVNKEMVYDSTAKVAHMLHEDLYIFNKAKRHQVAYILGIQPETLSRILKKLVRNDIIKTDCSNKIIITNKEELKKIFN